MSDRESPTLDDEGPPPVAYRRGRSPFGRRPAAPLLQRAVPVSANVLSYRPKTARRDLVPGLTAAALALPSRMACAEVAGLPLGNGLYALLLPTVLYTFLGSSRQLIVGPEGSIATLVAAAMLPLAAAGSRARPGASSPKRHEPRPYPPEQVLTTRCRAGGDV